MLPRIPLTNIPQLRYLGFELLLTRQIVVGARCDSVDTASSPLVNGELLLVPLELPRELLDAVFEVLLAGLSSDE